MSVRIPENPTLPNGPNVNLVPPLTQALSEMAREINRTSPEDQSLAVSWFLGA